MPINTLDPILMADVTADFIGPPRDWLWDGYLAKGDITLLTSRWKSGKTTLLAGLLQHLGTGTPFLGRATRPARVFYVSEESQQQWAERRLLYPMDEHVGLLSRPFFGQPELNDWKQLIDRAVDGGRKKRVDLFVIDPLAPLLPAGAESDAASLMVILRMLQKLTDSGVSVLLVHHPRKEMSSPGSSARGTGALLGFVDTSIELERVGTANADANRRILLTQSRRPTSPARLTYEWNPETGAFAVVADPRDHAFDENWQTVRSILEGFEEAVSQREIAALWPEDSPKPALSTLYAWLHRAHARKLVRREGRGLRNDPWQYRLEGSDGVRESG